MSKNNNNAGNVGSIFDDVDEDNRTVLHYTCYIGSIEIFKLITAKIKDKRVLNHQDAFNFTPLHLAAYRYVTFNISTMKEKYQFNIVIISNSIFLQ